MRRSPAFGELSIHAEMNFESRGIPFVLRSVHEIPKRTLDRKWRNSGAERQLRFSFSFSRVISRDGESCLAMIEAERVGWMVEIEPSVSTIEKSFSFFGIEECCFDKKYFKPSFFSSLGWSNVCVCIKIFWLKWNFRFLDISWLV